MVDVKVLTPDDVDNVTVVMDSNDKLKAVATAIRPSETIDVNDLVWSPYPHATNLVQATWTFKGEYKKPFITQMHTADIGLGVLNPVMYLYDLTTSKVTVVTPQATLNSFRARTPKRYMWLRVEETDGVVAPNGNGGGNTQITEQQFNTYLTQNLEVVEQVSNFHDGWGNWIDSPFGVRIDGRQHMIDRVGRIKGTNWLVFGSSTMT